MHRLLFLVVITFVLIMQIEYTKTQDNLPTFNDQPDAISIDEENDTKSVASTKMQRSVLSLVTDAEEISWYESNLDISYSQCLEIYSELYRRKYGEVPNISAFFKFDNDLVSRYEFARMFATLCKDETYLNECNYITDVYEDNPYYEDVRLLYNVGIIAGSNEHGAFFGDSKMSVDMARKMTQRLFDESLRVNYNPTYMTMASKLDVKNILQNPELPTGCEVTSLAIVLNYLGFDVKNTELADDYLDSGEIGFTNPYKAFVGTPYDAGSYGCFAPVIETCANKYLMMNHSSLRAIDITGVLPQYLFIEIERGNPVIVWGTMNMIDCEWIDRWEIDGEIIQFPLYEHCMVLHGFDVEKNVVYVADPLVGNVEYDMDLFFEKYSDLLCQAVVIK